MSNVWRKLFVTDNRISDLNGREIGMDFRAGANGDASFSRGDDATE